MAGLLDDGVLQVALRLPVLEQAVLVAGPGPRDGRQVAVGVGLREVVDEHAGGDDGADGPEGEPKRLLHVVPMMVVVAAVEVFDVAFLGRRGLEALRERSNRRSRDGHRPRPCGSPGEN